MSLSFSAHSAYSRIDSVVLTDYSIISGQEISAINTLDSKVDYIELESGSRVEFSEIKQINFKNKTQENSYQYHAKKISVGGDGSGG